MHSMAATDRTENTARSRKKNRAGTVRFFSVTERCAPLFLLLSSLLSGCLATTCPVPTSLGNLGTLVNSPWDDYAPVVPDTATLIFTSNRVQRGRTGLQGTYSDRRPARLMLTMRLAAAWDEAQYYEILFGKKKNAEIATVSFPPMPNPLNALAYGTSCDGEDKGCDIFVVSGGETEALTNPGPGLNSPDWDGFPFVTADGSRLYFASDRTGGYGGTDIWYAERDANGLWGPPQNAGSKVNSARDELSPFQDSATGALYFAAMTPENGLDIFVLEPGASGRVPLASPYNSPADDFTPFLKEGKIYLASNREGGCGGYDLYAFPMAE